MADLSPVFTALRAQMAPFAGALVVQTDTPTELYLNTRHPQKNGRPLFFGAVRVGKACVSYHLMPVYVQPQLVVGISPALKARMQGQSCFNFKVLDPALFAELGALTQAGYEHYRKQGWVPPAP